MMRAHVAAAAVLTVGVVIAGEAGATGLATCNSGPETGWQPQAALQQQLEAQGWQVRRMKVDGGCYEVYALDAEGRRVESYFHPVTFEHVLTTRR